MDLMSGMISSCCTVWVIMTEVDKMIDSSIQQVQTGFGRCGDNFWGFQDQDVIPDIGVSTSNTPLRHLPTCVHDVSFYGDALPLFCSYHGKGDRKWFPTGCRGDHSRYDQIIVVVVLSLNLMHSNLLSSSRDC